MTPDPFWLRQEKGTDKTRKGKKRGRGSNRNLTPDSFWLFMLVTDTRIRRPMVTDLIFLMGLPTKESPERKKEKKRGRTRKGDGGQIAI